MDATSRHLAARLLCVGFEGTTLPASARELFDLGVSFAVLFARNVVDPAQLAALNESVKLAGHSHVGICVDQEGGRVRRLRDGFTMVPPMREVGRIAGELARREPAAADRRRGRSKQSTAKPYAYQIGALLGTELRAVGIDVNFGPVLDVDTNPDNPVIADRSLSRCADEVARFGCEIMNGLQDVGVAACGKHFPGHGDTSQDSHYALPRLDHDLKRLSEVELVPFIAAARCGVAAMMTSHIVFAPIDPEMPATLSPAVLGGLLRGQIGYDGVVFSDDMEMKAIANFYDFDEAVVRTIEAGADVVTICHTLEKQRRAIEVLAAAIDNGRLARARVQQSIARIERLHEKYVRSVEFAPYVLASDAHRAVIDRTAVTVADGVQDPTEYHV